MRSVKCACRMSNPGGSRRNGAMKIRLTSECSVIPTSSGVMRESRGFARTRTPTYARPVFVVHHSIWPRACQISPGESYAKRQIVRRSCVSRNDTSFVVAPSPPLVMCLLPLTAMSTPPRALSGRPKTLIVNSREVFVSIMYHYFHVPDRAYTRNFCGALYVGLTQSIINCHYIKF